ncbi:A-kinase anchor protein 6-like [Oncorhynchus keta]|uniref:A-kinase anchor protein 6-like n=1 Tax=Oncorhynchus keta TaxID=8018 RepID=UPI00227B148A|nr:A-kinase anchor protein 6-like [Oncorhynchus keta]XP_052342396.1 A-kinase anchor protein 6-like [Oncorhynchus keta]XP_052342397.1 A-kinase anchor protein 6-like [Oncorhynchus keta]
MIAAVSPMACEAVSPMITSVTPTLESCPKEEEEAGLSPSQGGLCGEGLAQEKDLAQRYQNKKPPPLHTGADWKVVLHLPEIETWLRATTERVRDLTYSVHQDSVNKHVDVHLVQLKDICEDISDHVEQIHALLETEFSLKLLSYSVNIIVDIRCVQLLWHQLRVSVLVLKERLLQGLQDSNGNYTRQTDILQAFSQDHDQTRLDALTEVDDCGQLTIKCSQDYFSLDCGITAYELSDYSPSEDQEGTRGPGQGQDPRCSYPGLEKDFPELIQSVDLLTITVKQNQNQGVVPVQEEEEPGTSIERLKDTLCSGGEDNNPAPGTTMHCGTPQNESTLLSKRPLQGSMSNEVSPTQPSLPKKPMYLEGEAETSLSLRRSTLPSSLQFQADLSRSTPSLLDPPDRSKFWLELDAVYPSNASQSYNSLHAMNDRNLQASRQSEAGRYQRQGGPAGAHIPLQRSSSEAGRGGHFPQDISPIPIPFSGTGECNRDMDDPQTVRDTNSPLLSPMRGPLDHESHDEASSEDSSPLKKAADWIIQRQGPRGPKRHLQAQALAEASPNPSEERWFGSDEFLALPAQLKKTEMLAMKLETLAKALPQRPGHQGHHESIQDVDDWELTEVNSDWEGEGPGSPNPTLGLPNLQQPYKRPFRVRMGHFSPTSSSDMAPSLDESLESGPLSDLLSEDEAWSSGESRMRDNNRGWSSGETRGSSTGSRRGDSNRLLLQPTTTSMVPHIETQCKPLIQQLQDDIQHHDNHPDIWGKIEGFVSKLDEFICWLREALETTENWMPPKAEMDSLKLYLETHLSFKLNVDSHCSLKDCVLEEGRQLLEVIISHKSGLRDMLQMTVHQWQELQRQIRRQHSWMLRTLDAIKAHILATEAEASQEAETTGPLASPKLESLQSHHEAQRDALDQLSLKLNSQQYCTGTNRRTGREYTQMSNNNSLQEFESDFQELWDWLMDMDSVVTDSYKLMMSEEQQQYLYKGNSVEMSMWHPKKTHLLGWAESLRRSGAQLPPDFDERVNAMTQKWDQLQKILGESVGSTSPSQDPRSALSPHTSSLLGRLEGRIKDLKVWLRDTELFIFNSCLRQEAEQDLQASTQLQHFKSLCLEVRGRRKGVSSVLRLCQRLQEQQSVSDSDQQALQLQLLTVNLERRWEAIVMQVLQWQTRLRRSLGTDQVPGNLVEAGLMDLHGPAEDSWEWDEMDMTIVEHMEPQEFDDKQNAECDSGPGSPGASLDYDKSEASLHVTQRGIFLSESSTVMPLSSQHPSVYQVYNLHNVELYRQPQFPSVHKTSSPAKAGRKQPLLKSLSKDSSFSSVESLPDLLGGLLGGGMHGGRGESARRSESESGIVSEGDTETTANSEICLEDPRRRGSTSLTPPTGDDSPGEKDEERDRVCDEDIDRILERANNVALYGDCVAVTALRDIDRDQSRSKAGKKRRGGEEGCGGGENWRRHRREPNVEILINGRGFCSDTEEDETHDERRVTGGKGRRDGELPHLSQGSSLESLYAAGELFPSGKDTLQRSMSLESWLAPCKSWEKAEGEGDGGSQGSLRELGLGIGAMEPTGELSRRTLELLKRLENIQTPLHDLKMTRSISDITLLSSKSLRLPGAGYGSGGPGHAGRLSGGRGGPPSSVNESSAASLTELSSTEDSSVGSEDLAVLRNRCCLLDSNASFRKHNHRAQPAGHHGGHRGHDEADASISMVVNVSCTSACTDDEDDSDLLSSSTLTLTEEELGIKEDEEEDSSVTSEEEYTEGSFALGLEYMKNEFHNWIQKPSRSQQQSQSGSGRDKNQGDDPLGDELQCGTLSRDNTSRPSVGNERRSFLSPTALRLLESHTNSIVKKECLQGRDVGDTNRKNATRSYISQFVDDMENGNVDNSHIKGKDEDDELLREEGSLFTMKGESFKEFYVNESSMNGGGDQRGGMITSTTPSSCETLSHLQAKESSLEGQLRGEIPCHSSSHTSPSLSPLEDCRGSHQHHILQRPPHSGNNSQENLFSSFLSDVHTQQSRREDGSNPGPDPNSDRPCCSHPHPQPPPRKDQKSQENVHNFVMEIIDMASVVLKNKESQAEDQERPGQTGAQIRDKVLEHSHRPIHLRKGDFYSYLSLSSHDSDCGEVSVCLDSKSTTPLLSTTPDIRDEEMLFEACTEEVYLGPPLCYSMAITKRPRRHSPKLMDYYSSSPSAQSQSQAPLPACNEYQKAHGISPGSIAESQLQCHNEASYLNPLPCETLIDTVECLADTEMLESNISPVMTKIRVSCSSTNPLKEEGSLCINPKINCPPIRKCDRDEKGPSSQWMKQKSARKGHSSLQEVKSTHKQQQSPRSGEGCGEVGGRGPQGSGPVSDGSSASKTRTARPQVRRQSGSVSTATSKTPL